MARKIKEVNKQPLIEPLNMCDMLTVEQNNQIAALMTEKIYLTNEKGVEIEFAF